MSTDVAQPAQDEAFGGRLIPGLEPAVSRAILLIDEVRGIVQEVRTSKLGVNIEVPWKESWEAKTLKVRISLGPKP